LKWEVAAVVPQLTGRPNCTPWRLAFRLQIVIYTHIH
jgi:hypothetical protein